MCKAGAVLSALLVLGATARAEQAPATADRAAARDEARAWFVKARADFDARRYTSALEALRRAHALQRLPVLLRYMGDCYFELAGFELAISHYRRYLERSPGAADRAYVESRLAAATRRARALREQELGGARVPARLMPTGKDGENPLRPAPVAPVPRGEPDDRHGSWLTVGKWSALALGVAGLAMGITFNRLAAAKANELRDAVRSACPPAAPGCGGNPELDAPVASYSLEHYELQRQLKRDNAIAVTSFVVGGIGAAGAAVLFWLDRAERRRRARRFGVAPVLGAGNLGLSGEVSF